LADVARSAQSGHRLLVVNLVACLLLLAQFLLGMVANLYVALPAHHPGAGASNYFGGLGSGLNWLIAHGPGWAAGHAVLGLALVVAALANIVFTWRRGSRPADSAPACRRRPAGRRLVPMRPFT
jgi:hypothetical protein